MSEQPVLTRVEDSVTIIEINRAAKRNALNTQVCTALHEAVDNAVAEGARAIVITGAGTAFCAGADLDGAYSAQFRAALYGMLHHLAEVAVPLIAAVNGPAIGGGTQLAMACDLRVADAGAVFAVPTPRNGLAIDAWTVRMLRELAGGGPARRLLLAAESFGQEDALRCGLADRSGTLADAIALAHEIAGFAPLALAYNKHLLNEVLTDPAQIQERFDAVWASEDVAEAAAARSEKRSPVFRGR